jgi:hypothetical protein
MTRTTFRRPPPVVGDRRPLDRGDLIALGSLVALAVAVPLLLSAAAGAIGVPGNDDWVYMRAAGSLYATGAVDMSGHTTAFIGQLLMVQPLLWLARGESWAFPAFGLVLTAVGVAATYLLARRFVGTSGAVLVALLVIVFPGFARESASFMTDIPAWALGTVTLWLGARWLQDDGGPPTLAASIVAGVVGVSIREFALAAPVAVLACAWLRNRAADRPLLAILSILLVAGVLGARATASATIGPGGAQPLDTERLLQLGPAFATLSAGVLPAIALAIGRRLGSIPSREVLAGAALACLVLLHPDGPLLGNLWTADGATGQVVLNGTRAAVIGALPWGLSRQLAVLAAILAATLVVGLILRHAPASSAPRALASAALGIARRPEGLLVVFAIGYAAELAAYAPLGNLFDRYLYPLMPVAAILLLRGTSPVGVTRSHAAAHGALAWLAGSAFLIAANSFAYDAARTRAGESAVAMGYPADTIDAGYEWTGTHATRPVVPKVVLHGWMPYDEHLAAAQPCVILSNSPLADDAMRLIRTDADAYRQYLLFGPAQPLHLYAVLTPECPTPPAEESAAAR